MGLKPVDTARCVPSLSWVPAHPQILCTTPGFYLGIFNPLIGLSKTNISSCTFDTWNATIEQITALHPNVMAKRKREPDQNGHAEQWKQPRTAAASKADSSTLAIQIITGAYEKTLHGVVALVPRKATEDENESAKFSDNFLFDAHSSVVRCLALSPISRSTCSDPPSIFLASGGLDEKINLFQLSALSPLSVQAKKFHKALLKDAMLQKPSNREIGSLLHHSSGITKLVFPNRKKLLSGAGDNVIAISRTQDWTVLSTIKAPIPIPFGRPSGDTVSLGDSPAGFNDFAIHPSLKLMISVGKGEKCMRLWNLVTGKKAGVLNFETALLRQVGEGRHSSGEGRKAAWNSEGDAFVIGFERGAVLFGMVSRNMHATKAAN